MMTRLFDSEDLAKICGEYIDSGSLNLIKEGR